jgi:hypothetical protein
VATDGIIYLTVTNDTAMSIGDDVYIDVATCGLGDVPEGRMYFGKILTAIAGTGTAAVRAVQLGSAQVILIGQNGETVKNATDAVLEITANDDATEMLDIQIYSTNTSTADNDYYRISYYIEDDNSEKTEIGGIDLVCTDVTTATEDARFDFRVIVAGTMTTQMSVDSDGVNIGSTGDAMTFINAGQTTIASGASSAAVSLTTIDADDAVLLTPLETLSSGTVYAQIEAASGFDVCLVDAEDGDVHNAGSDLTIAYLAIQD